MKTVAFVIGTRPEIIKCAPVVKALNAQGKLRPVVVLTGQHSELAKIALQTFDLAPSIVLDLMKENQTPVGFIGRSLPEVEKHLGQIAPNLVLVQGDTTSALVGAIAAFHLKIPVGHIEAGLRSFDFDAPFPEEMNRVMISRIASLHFCPTPTARGNLEREGISQQIHLVGNTVVDAALEAARIIDELEKAGHPAVPVNHLSGGKPIVFVTGHRRENFDQPLKNLCWVLRELVQRNNLEVVFPVHLNPNVRKVVFAELQGHPGISLIEPVDYLTSISLIRASSLIITDSGGIQEEAPSFGTPVIVTRRTTERPEAIACGAAVLCNLSDTQEVLQVACKLLARGRFSTDLFKNPFGDGTAALQIAAILQNYCSAID